MMNEKLLARFAAKFERRGDDECWEWKAGRTRFGYGAFSMEKVRLAHRAAYILFVGPIPDGMVVRHRCDNPPCVNPAHLVIGSQEQNMQDAIERDRFPKGDAHHSLKLREKDVREILRSDAPADELAARYGVNRDYISMIQRGVRWAHVVADDLPERVKLRRQYGNRGQGHHATHLTPSDVLLIRSDPRTNREVGLTFGVSATTVSQIKNGKQWAHVASDGHEHRRTDRPDFAPCAVPGCDGNSGAAGRGSKGYCKAHYHRLWRYGDPLFSPRR